MADSLDRQTIALGERILKSLDGDASVFSRDGFYRRVMDWSIKNAAFKTQMFRFVDVLPYLSSSAEITRHLKEYFAEGGEDLPPVFNFGLGLGSLAPGLLAGGVKKNVTAMAKMFITGDSPADALPALVKARANDVAFTADLLGEAAVSEAEAAEYLRRYRELITLLADAAPSWPPRPQIDTDALGPIPRVNVSIKISALFSQIVDAAWDDSLERAKRPVREIFRLAMARGVFINLDQEQYGHKEFILQLFCDLIQDPEFKDYPHFGIVVQAYLKDARADVDRLVKLARARRVPFTVRLVKGAYWDFETVQARQRGWPVPVFTNKPHSDASFEACARALIDAYPALRLALGSHNVRSIAAGITYARARNLPPGAIEIQMLFGMADSIKRAVAKEGYRVREYATIGELIPGMAYLVRRLLENSSNESFLRAKFSDDVATEILLRDPSLADLTRQVEAATEHFVNEPPINFAVPAARAQMTEALAWWRKHLGRTYPAVIDGANVVTAGLLTRENPAKSGEVIGSVSACGVAEADRAIHAAEAALPAWSNRAATERADLLDRLADRMVADKFKLAALQTLEVGKPWREAEGDVAEAIDFCRYYAREMRILGQPFRVGRTPGEHSVYAYRPRGVTLVIAPWNFPLAILTGMVAAAIVTGNTVVMKPAEQSSIIGAELMRLLTEAKCPPGVVNFVPGRGEEVGKYLVAHPRIAMICFTGSREVGLQILRAANEPLPGQRHLKRVIAELGGKNAIIVDSDADLDEAVTGVMHSAFGYAGQKCSACSRVIVLEPLYERFLERLIEATRSVSVGDPADPRTLIGPVVDAEAAARITRTIANAGATVAFTGNTPPSGHFVPPTIFRDVDPASKLAQEEIFGPVLAVIKAADLDEALRIANDTPYALTGGVYSRSPAHIARVKREFEVGNLYVNRGITGAMVERHPFGGYKMSGVGSKTGGPDYLRQFTEPVVITENTMRRGFVPED